MLSTSRHPWTFEDRAAFAGLLREAEDEFVVCDVFAFGDMARRQRGLVLGGSLGQQLIAEADRALIARGVVDTERFTTRT